MWSFQETISLSPAELVLKLRRAIGFRVVKVLNDRRRDRFHLVAPERYIREYSTARLPGIHVYSFCGARSVHEQVLSTLSFLRYAGIPETWTVVSDGSLTGEMEKMLLGLHPVLRVASWTDFITNQNRDAVELLAKTHALGKKLALVTALPTDRVTVYIDSDVLFFSGAAHLQEVLKNPQDNYYVEEWSRYFPPGLLTAEEEKLPPVNSGFLIQARPIDWAAPLARLRQLLQDHPQAQETLGDAYVLLEQTVVQIAYHACGARILDPAQYVINKADAWKLRDEFDYPSRVMRHYLSYLRPKMWAEAANYYR